MEIKSIIAGVALGAGLILVYQKSTDTTIVEWDTLHFTQKENTTEQPPVESIQIHEVTITDMDYAYSMLDESEKTMYLEILSTLQNMQPSRKLSSKKPEIIEKVFTCVMNDHPELFYVNGYKFTKYTVNQEISEIVFQPNYIMEYEQAEQYRHRIQTYASECQAGIPKNATDYEIIKYIYDYIISNTEYDCMASNNQNICSVFIGHRSVCQGYAKSLQYLLQQNGIWCTIVTGTANNESHAWNIVRLKGEYFHVDATWGDSSYMYQYGSNLKNSTINYDYFLVPDYSIRYTHRINNVVPLPECNSNNENYYVHEQLFLEDYDADKIRSAFDEAYLNNTYYVSFKFNNQITYDFVREKLIDEQEVFAYLPEENSSLQYVEKPDLLIMGFYY